MVDILEIFLNVALEYIPVFFCILVISVYSGMSTLAFAAGIGCRR